MFLRSGGLLAAITRCQVRAAFRNSSRLGSANTAASAARSRRWAVVSS